MNNTKDKINASPPHIVDSGASVKTLANFIDQENRVEILKEHMYRLYEEINRLKGENARLKRELENLMDGRC